MSLVFNCDLELFKQYIKNSSSFNQVQIKLGYSANSGKVIKLIKKRCEQNNIDISHFTYQSSVPIKRNELNIFIENSNASQKVLREWYKKGKYTEYKCAICGQEPFWNNKELTLTLDHINGINNDDRLENLRWVCPNCDRQLETYGSKNIKNTNKKRINETKKNEKINNNLKQKPCKNELQNILFENKGNFTKVGKIYNVTDNAVRKWCKLYQLSTYSIDYKNT